jgi:GT2 family glycosyltransferase
MRLAAPEPVPIQVSASGHRLAEWTVDAQPRWYEVTIPPADLVGAANVIQNAGSRVYVNGAGEDRGTVSRNGLEFYETDHGQYDLAEEVFAACGGSCLLRRAMLDDVGLLDEDFFAYYEDTDLSWRARLRGWKILYVPASVVYHVHCGTNQAGSSQFYYFVFRNRLAMLLKNAALSTALREWVRFGGWTLLEAFRWSACALQRRTDAREKLRRWMIQMYACLSLFGWLPRLIARRAQIQRRRTVPQAEIDRWLIPIGGEPHS